MSASTTGTRFHLVDVGASGGIAEKWRVFGDRLSAVAFDPLVEEIRRLQALETRPDIRYEPAFVGCPELERGQSAPRAGHLDARDIQPYVRSSAVAAQRILQQDYARDVFNSGAPLEYADRTVSLDSYFAEGSPPDFIKIDTDGGDYSVVRGARRLLERGVLGLEVEMQFHGAAHDRANTFSNIDRCLRELGFSLFELSPYRYTRAALPGPFLYDVAAQTTVGQIVWGEAVYFRDVGHESYDQTFKFVTTRDAALKLCSLFVLFGLYDCAAELLIGHTSLESLPEKVDLLNLLTPPTLGPLRYDEYLSSFEAEPTRLFPSRLAATGRANVGSAPYSSAASAVVLIPGVTGIESLTATTWHGSLERRDDGVKLTTAAIPWSYAAAIEIDRSRVNANGPLRLRLEACVERGRIGIGALSADGTAFLAEQQLGEHPGFVVADLELPSLDDVKHVIVRNVHLEGTASEVVFKHIALYMPAVEAV